MYGTITVGGVLTSSTTINANGGINIPLAVGAPTNTSAVNRFYALGLAGETNILTTNAFLNTTTITKTGTSTVTQTVPYHLASIKVPPGTHSTIQANFEVSNPQWNYSSFSGFSFIWRATGAAKLTFGIGRGAKTVRSDLSIDSYSIIPANDLAYNQGEILDITFDNVRDTQRNGYTVRVREIYALDSTAGWQVKPPPASSRPVKTNPSLGRLPRLFTSRTLRPILPRMIIWVHSGSCSPEVRQIICIKLPPAVASVL